MKSIRKLKRDAVSMTAKIYDLYDDGKSVATANMAYDVVLSIAWVEARERLLKVSEFWDLVSEICKPISFEMMYEFAKIKHNQYCTQKSSTGYVELGNWYVIK